MKIIIIYRMITFSGNRVYTLNSNYKKAFDSILDLEKPENSQVDIILINSHVEPERGGDEGLWDCLLEMYDRMQRYARENYYDYMFIVDPDVIFPKNALIDLIVTNADVACGLVPERPSKVKDWHRAGRPPNGWAISMPWNKNHESVEGIRKNKLFRVTGSGSEASTLLNRRAIDTTGLFIRTRYSNSPDFTFWDNARKANLICLCNPNIRCKHMEADGTIIGGPDDPLEELNKMIEES